MGRDRGGAGVAGSGIGAPVQQRPPVRRVVLDQVGLQYAQGAACPGGNVRRAGRPERAQVAQHQSAHAEATTLHLS